MSIVICNICGKQLQGDYETCSACAKTSNFEVGDWVNLYTTYKQTQPFKVLALNSDKTRVFLNTNESPNSDNWWYTSQCTLWQPKLGEWCWLAADLSTYILAKFGGKSDKDKYRSQSCLPNAYNYDMCEPFIGTLPFSLKA